MLLCGLAPAVKALRQDLIASCARRTRAPRRAAALSATGWSPDELALTLVLLMGAGLTLKNLILLQKMDLGFRGRACAARRRGSSARALSRTAPEAGRICRNRAARRRTAGVEAIGVLAPSSFPSADGGARRGV